MKRYVTKLLLALGLVGMCCNHGLWAETLDEFCSTLSENGFLVPSGQEMTLQSGKDSAEKKACDFLNRQEGINPSTVLLRRYGMFTQEFRTKKQLNVNFCKHRYYHLPPKPGETITVDLRPSIMLGDRATDGRLKCAVLVLGHAQLAADECDDTSIGTLRVRSLPSGVIKSSFKDATRDGMKVKVVPTYPKDPNEREWFQIMVYAPGSPSKRPVCCVIENWILSQNDAKILSACVQDAELKEEYRKQLQAHSSLYLLDNIFDNMRGGLRAKGLLIAPLSGSGCPKWARFLRDLHAAEVNEGNVAQWVEKLKSLEDAGTYLYAPNSDRGCEYHWYDHHSALARALFFSREIPSKLVCNLRTSYVLLARQYNVSPEWIHRILVLYFAINPYKVHDFTERGVERCLPNVRDICTFFNDDCWPIVRRYCGGDVNAELIKALIDAQSTELGNWWRDFQAVIRQMNKRKAEQPDLANCFKRKVGAPALENARQEALDAAQQLFRLDQLSMYHTVLPPSHVCWSRCLWQRIPIPRAESLLRKYLAETGGKTVGDLKEYIHVKWTETWNGQPPWLSVTDIKGRTLQDDEWRDGAVMRANGGCMVTKETSTAWLKYNYGGDPVRIVGLKSLQKLQAIGNCYLNRFYVATDFGLKLMYALTKFLETARTYPESLEFQAIQRATGVKNFSELLQDTAWKVFVSQAIDNPVLEGRCLDGALSSLKMSLPAIIKPKMPEGVIPLYLWTEDSLQRYCESFMAIFDSNLISGDSEERTYGLPWLAWKMNPILGLPMEPKSTYHEGDYDHGRHPVNHCLQPLKTGQFPDEAGSRGVTAFLHKGNKKNTTKYSTNEFEFTYITPFSPVTIFHHDGYMLFAKRIWPELADVMEDYGHKAFDMLMKLLFLDEDIRREYLTFIAPLDARPATDGQLKRWVSQDGKKIVPTSFGAMPILGECSGYDGSELLSSHLRWWKVRAQGGRYSFYPSFESWKRVAVSLGYARETGGINNTATDLSALTYVPPVPTFVLAEEDPKPPAKIFYKHFNIWRERIDIELKNSDAKNPRSRSHPSNGRDPVQWTPPAFDRLYSAREICDHADPTQRLFYNALFPNGAKLIRLVEQERELAEIKKDLRRWREFVQRSESEDLSSAEMAELDAFWGKYPDTRINDLPSRIATLEIAWCDGKLALNPGRYDRTLYERLKEVNQDLMAWQRIVDPDRRVNLKHQEESHEQLRRKYGDYSSQLPNIQRAIVAAKLDIAKYDQNRWRALLERQRVGNLQPQEIDEFNELQSRYEDGMIRLIVIALTQKLNALRGGDADDDSDAFFEVDE